MEDYYRAVTNHFVTGLLWEEEADEFAGTEIKLHPLSRNGS